jgi:hypothetical protein
MRLALHALRVFMVVIPAVQAAAGQPTTSTFVVPGTVPWANTGLFLTSGQPFSVSASGTIDINVNCYPGESGYCATGAEYNSPNGNSAYHYPVLASQLTDWSLIGRIGNGAPFEVGSNSSLVANNSGVLYLSINDSYFGDNSGSWTANITAAVKPVILFNGVNVTNQPQSAVVGQQINLTALVPSSNGSVSSQIWTIRGNPVGGYTPGLDPQKSNPVVGTNSSAVAFYWVQPTAANSSFEVGYTYTTTSNATQRTLHTQFSVAGAPVPHVGVYEHPPVTEPPAIGDSCVVYPQNCNLFYKPVQQLAMGFGNPYTTTNFGMAIGTDTSPPSGTLEWVQLILNDVTVATNDAGTKLNCTKSAGLDTSYPLPPSVLDPPIIGFIPTFALLDYPSYSLVPGLLSISRSFDAQTYLLWRPSNVNGPSIPVPLGSWKWGFIESSRVDRNPLDYYPWTTPRVTIKNSGKFSTDSPKYPTWKGKSAPILGGNC